MSDVSDVYVPVDDRYRLGVVNVDRPFIPEEVVRDSRFSSVNRALDYSAIDFIDSSFCEDDWSDLADFLGRNGFELGEWDFTVRKDEGLYSLEVSPDIEYRAESSVADFFKPNLEVRMVESEKVRGTRYSPSIHISVNDPENNQLGFPEPVFHKILAELYQHSRDVMTEGLETEVY